MKSKNYVFNEVNGKLEFVGKFDEFYQDIDDPWGQSATGEMAEYYQSSRKTLLNILHRFGSNSKVAEIGCGLGYVTSAIAESIDNANVVGFDISPTALSKAKQLFPSLEFRQADITSENNFSREFDVVVINQILWYVLEGIDELILNVKKMLKDGGYFIISNAYAREQRYGVDVINKFPGAISFFGNLECFSLVEVQYYDHGFEHADGHIVLKYTKCGKK